MKKCLRNLAHRVSEEAEFHTDFKISCVKKFPKIFSPKNAVLKSFLSAWKISISVKNVFPFSKLKTSAHFWKQRKIPLQDFKAKQKTHEAYWIFFKKCQNHWTLLLLYPLPRYYVQLHSLVQKGTVYPPLFCSNYIFP